MVALSSADALYAGATQVDAVYAGATLVWSAAPPAAPPTAHATWTFTATVIKSTDAYVVTLAADGTDQSASLIAQIAAAPNGPSAANPTLVLLPSDPAGYRLDQSITISGRSNLVIRPAEGERFACYTNFDGIELGIVAGNGTSTRRHWTLAACTDVTLSGVDLTGPNDERTDGIWALYAENRAFEHGFSIQIGNNIPSVRCTIEDCTFTNVYGDGIYIGANGANRCRDITMRNITGTYCGRQGAGVVNVDGCLIEDVDIQWGGRSGMDVEPNHSTHAVKNMVMRRVTMGCRFYPFVVGGSTTCVRENFLLEDCVGINSSSSHTAMLANRLGTTMTIRRHTDLRQRSVAGFSFGGWDGDIIVEDCDVSSGPSTPTSCGVALANCSADVTITGSTFNGVSGSPGVGGADELYLVTGTTVPASISHCGNVWNMGASNDGAC